MIVYRPYDVLSHRRTLADDWSGPGGIPGGGLLQWSYDPAGRLAQLVSPANDNLGFDHDPAGRLTLITRPNAMVTSLTYDPQGRLDSLVQGSAALDIAAYTYQYDALGNVETIDESATGGPVKGFLYDALSRLTAVTHDAAPAESYQLDALGNREVTHRSATHLLDDANRLLGDDDFAYTYDANGNLRTKTAVATAETTTYHWDAQNQLIRIDFPGGGVATYAYDALGRRIQKDVDGSRHPSTSTTARTFFSSSTWTDWARPAWRPASATGRGTDQPLVMERGGQSYFYHADHLGSIRLVTDAAGGRGQPLRLRFLRQLRDPQRGGGQPLRLHRPGVRPRKRALLLPGPLLRRQQRAVPQRGPARLRGGGREPLRPTSSATPRT